MQELGLAIVESGGDVFSMFDEWPNGKPKGDIGQMIARPTTTAFRMVWVTLEKHLLTVAGEATLKAARDRIAAVVRESVIPETSSTQRTLQWWPLQSRLPRSSRSVRFTTACPLPSQPRWAGPPRDPPEACVSISLPSSASISI